MDSFDRKILSELQLDGRLTVTELADRVGLSLSPCHRRLKALEQSGAICDYRAQLDPRVLGLNFSALVFVTMKDGNQESMSKFETAVADIRCLSEIICQPPGRHAGGSAPDLHPGNERCDPGAGTAPVVTKKPATSAGKQHSTEFFMPGWLISSSPARR